MDRKIQWIIVSAILLTGTGVWAQQSPSLKHMPPIMHKLLMRGHRIELIPALGITVNDKYTRSLLLQLRGAYHVNDWFGVGIEITYGASSKNKSYFKTGLTRDIESQVSKAHNGTSFTMSRTYINLLALPYVSFTPFAGKFVVFDNFLGYADIHFDLGAGLAYVGAYEGTSDSLGSSATWTAMFGGGMRYFPIKGLSIILSVHDYLVKRALNTSYNGSSSRELTNNLAVLIGVGFYFPQVPQRTK